MKGVRVMSFGLVLFLSTIVITALAGACGLVVYLEHNFPSEKYDERQKAARGNAYRFSQGVGMVYYIGLLAYFVFHTGKSEWPLEPFLLLMLGILIQLLSFHIYCLITHSALPLGEKPLPMVVSYSLLGIMYLVQFFAQYIPEDTPWLVGAESYNLFRLLLAFSFFSLAILHLITLLRKEKE